jgi:hypothetical protein
MRTLLGTQTLNNTRWIYQEGKFYIVKVKDRRGNHHERKIPSSAVEYLGEKLRLGSLDTQSATAILEPVAEELRLRDTYGYQLGFLAQDILLILVVLGEATKTQRGRGWVYTARF